MLFLFSNHTNCRRAAPKALVGRIVRKAVIGTLGMLAIVLTSGCGQVMVRKNPCGITPCSQIDDGCPESCLADRLELMKAKLGWRANQFKGGAGRCSEKISECWYSSRLAQWAAKKREQANAPPLPKFHPIPTHPALFPETCESDDNSHLQDSIQH